MARGTGIEIDFDESFQTDPESYSSIHNMIGEPHTDSWELPTLNIVDAHGKRRFWNIRFDHKCSSLVISHGEIGGEVIESKKKVKTNLSGRNIQEQAYLEAKSRYNVKLHNDYYIEGDAADNKPVMKGYPFKTTLRINYPVLVDTKLDGHRIVIVYRNGKITYRSRLGLNKKNMFCFDNSVLSFLKHLADGVTLDCEIYNHNFTFEQISSIVAAGTEKDVSQLNLYVFDYYTDVNNEPFEIRRHNIENAMIATCEELDIEYEVEEGVLLSTDSSNMKKVAVCRNPTSDFSIKIPICKKSNSPNSVYRNMRRFIKLGYEGAMVKIVSNGCKKDKPEYKRSCYKHGRGSSCYKVKEFHTAEGICIDVMRPKVEDGCSIIKIEIDDGIVFNATMMGTFAFSKKVYENRHDCIGKVVEYKYCGKTVNNKPKFAKAMNIRNLEL